jgi:hypothetical protein
VLPLVRCVAVALYNPALAAFDFKLLSAWISQSTSNTRRRQLLVQQGQDQIVIGMEVRQGLGLWFRG